MSEDKILTGLAVIGVLVCVCVGAASFEYSRETTRMQKDGLCIDGMLYSIDRYRAPTVQRFGADGKPAQCVEQTPPLINK